MDQPSKISPNRPKSIQVSRDMVVQHLTSLEPHFKGHRLKSLTSPAIFIELVQLNDKNSNPRYRYVLAYFYVKSLLFFPTLANDTYILA